MDINISIHAPRGGSDPCVSKIPFVFFYFNPRSPWGERLDSIEADDEKFQFQSTLPVGGATPPSAPRPGTQSDFNPRSPWGERPGLLCRFHRLIIISIHAPRGGSDRHSPLFSLP